MSVTRRALLGLPADIESIPPRAVIGERCLNAKGVVCDACKDACDARAIVRLWSSARVALVTVKDDLCTGCGECVKVCPSDAIALRHSRASGDPSSSFQILDSRLRGNDGVA